MVALLVQLHRDATREPFRILRVAFPHDLRTGKAEYRRVLRAQVGTSRRGCVITLPTQVLLCELRRSNACVADLLGDAARRELAHGQNPHSIAGWSKCSWMYEPERQS